MKRAALALVLVVAALAALARVGGRRGRSEPAAPNEAPPAPEAEGAKLATTPARDEERAPINDATLAPATAGADAAPEAASQTSRATPSRLRLSGTLVVVDENGAEHPAEDGAFALVACSGSTMRTYEVGVLTGRWGATLAREGDEGPLDGLRVGGIALGGRAAKVEAAGLLPIPADGRLDLRARWVPRTVLHVRDRATNRDLRDVTVVESDSTFPPVHPDASATVSADWGNSPLVLRPSVKRTGDWRTFHVSARDYGWARLRFDEAAGGEHFVLLAPAGTLQVLVEGASPPQGAVLRLHDASDDLFYENELAALGKIDIGSIPAGSYRVAAEVGARGGRAFVLAEAATVVVARETANARLQLRVLEFAASVPLAGTLLVPAEWGLEDFVLRVQLAGDAPRGSEVRLALPRAEMGAEDEPPTLFRWTAPRVPTGHYAFSIAELGWCVAHDVGPAGDEDVRLEVPPPAEVRVRVVDAASGRELAGASVSWSPESTHGLYWRSARLERDDALGRYVGFLPLGTSWLSASAAGYAATREPITVPPGGCERVVALERLTGIRLTLVDGGASVAWPDGAPPRLVPAEGQSDRITTGSSARTITLSVPEPGLYRLILPEVPGYEPVPEELVRLEKGVVAEREIELARHP